MIRHVSNVVAHFKGKVSQWDVVNEAFADGPSGQLRPDSPFTALGPTFIEEAFRAAHEADPEALLFYNDYEIQGLGTAKAEAVYKPARRLKAAGVPIGGVGFQMHVDPRHWPAADVIRQNLERFAALGLAVELTEMDVPVGEMLGWAGAEIGRAEAPHARHRRGLRRRPRLFRRHVLGLHRSLLVAERPDWRTVCAGAGPITRCPFDADYRSKADGRGNRHRAGRKVIRRCSTRLTRAKSHLDAGASSRERGRG